MLKPINEGIHQTKSNGNDVEEKFFKIFYEKWVVKFLSFDYRLIRSQKTDHKGYLISTFMLPLK